MTTRMSASTLTPSTRVSVDDLTPLEREAMTSEGQIGPEGFVDIERPAAPEMVDAKAEARKKAVADLKSVAGGPPVKAQESPQQAADKRNAPELQEYVKEIAELQAKLQSRSPCPRCGLELHESCEVKASSEDIAEFLKCVLAGSTFAKSYKLFGGALSIEFRTRDGATDELVRRVVTEAMRAKEITSETEVFALMRQLTMAAALKSYISRDVTLRYEDLPKGSTEEFRKAAEERMSKIPAHIQGFMRPIATDFHMLVDLLTARAQDPSFWVGTPA